MITVARRVYVGNLDWSVTWQDLKDHFRSVGNGMPRHVFVTCRQSGDHGAFFSLPLAMYMQHVCLCLHHGPRAHKHT